MPEPITPHAPAAPLYLAGFTRGSERHAEYLIRHFSNGESLVVTSQDGCSLPDGSDWMACYYPFNWVENCGDEASSSWCSDEDFNGELHFIADLSDEIEDCRNVDEAARTIRLRSNCLTASDARWMIGELGFNEDEEWYESLARVLAVHWSQMLGIGWHLDTPGAEYTPAMSAEDIATYDSDMDLIRKWTADPYATAAEAMEEAHGSAQPQAPADAPKAPETVLEAFGRAFPNSYIHASEALFLASMPIDSTCGADCLAAISAGAELTRHFDNALGIDTAHHAAKAVAPGVVAICRVYICG